MSSQKHVGLPWNKGKLQKLLIRKYFYMILWSKEKALTKSFENLVEWLISYEFWRNINIRLGLMFSLLFTNSQFLSSSYTITIHFFRNHVGFFQVGFIVVRHSITTFFLFFVFSNSYVPKTHVRTSPDFVNWFRVSQPLLRTCYEINDDLECIQLNLRKKP